MQADDTLDCVAESASQDDDRDATDEECETAEQPAAAPQPPREGPDWCFGSGSFQSAIPPACLEGAGGGVILGIDCKLAIVIRADCECWPLPDLPVFVKVSIAPITAASTYSVLRLITLDRRC
jgi:hypothetical protein